MASVPVPSHTASGILIKLHSATLNPSNYKIIPAKMPFVRHMRQFTVGYDASGTVVSIGDDAACAHLKVGDAAFGMAPLGSIGEYAVLGCAAAARKPSCLSHAEAAGLNVAALTSLSALERGGVEKGHKVLILGASGGCGMFGVAIGALLGAEVTGVCSTRNTEFVRQRGAAHVVDYTDAAQMAALQAQGAGSFDVVYDTVSSFDPVDPDYEPSMRPLLKPDGRYVYIYVVVHCPPHGHPFCVDVSWVGTLERMHTCMLLVPTAHCTPTGHSNGSLSPSNGPPTAL